MLADEVDDAASVVRVRKSVVTMPGPTGLGATFDLVVGLAWRFWRVSCE